jgi:superoxide dismutase
MDGSVGTAGGATRIPIGALVRHYFRLGTSGSRPGGALRTEAARKIGGRMNDDQVTRRSFLGTITMASTTLMIADRGRTFGELPPPKETGLSSEGLLEGLPGFQPRTIAPLPHEELPGFLSRSQLASHHSEYVKTVRALKTAEEALGATDRAAPNRTYAELRRKQVETANSMLLHEFYFRNLAPEKVEFPRYLNRHMGEHIGSLDSWTADFAACALAAKSWAALVYDPYDDRWHNVVMDGDAEGTWIGANPLVVCDVCEHAYTTDYKKKEDYVAKFIERVDWNEVAARYKKVDRM